jgi:hypothetical protein
VPDTALDPRRLGRIDIQLMLGGCPTVGLAMEWITAPHRYAVSAVQA